MTTFNPDYDLIKRYIKEEVVNPEYFSAEHFSNLKYCIKKVGESRFNEIITPAELKKNNNEIAYFFVYYTLDLENSNWAKDVELFKVWNNFNSQLQDLKLLLKKLNTYKNTRGLYHKEIIKFDHIKSIRIKTNNGKSITIDSYPLAFDIANILDEAFQNKEVKKDKNDTKKIQSYIANFFQDLFPFYLFLKNETGFKGKKDTDIYDYLTEFLSVIGFDWNTVKASPQEYLKDSFKKIKRGNTD